MKCLTMTLQSDTLFTKRMRDNRLDEDISNNFYKSEKFTNVPKTLLCDIILATYHNKS